jgi:hypothetical protein
MKMGGLLGEGAGVGPQDFEGQQPTDPQPNVSPEEQEQYNRVVKNGMEILYTEEGRVLPEVVNRLGTKDPVNSLSQTAVWLVMMVENSAKQSGFEISDDVLMHAGKELFDQLMEISEAHEIHDFTEKDVQASWYNALDMWREANSGEGGRFDEMAAAEQFIELNEADKEGRAEEIVPGFEKLPQAYAMQPDQEEPTA